MVLLYIQLFTERCFFILSSITLICHCTAFWLPWFLMRNWLLIVLKIPCTWWILSILLLWRFSLSLISDSLIIMCLSVDLFQFILLRGYWDSWMCRFMSFILLEKFGAIISSNILYISFSPLLGLPLSVCCNTSWCPLSP